LYKSPIQIAAAYDSNFTSGNHNLERRIYFRPSIFRPESYYYYAQSSTTTAASYVNRHKPEQLREYRGNLFQKDRRLRRFWSTVRPWTYSEYLDNIDDPTKRRFYARYVQDIIDGRPIRSDNTPFTKLEKTLIDELIRKYKAPRSIQARHPTFNIEYGCYIKPLERHLKHRREFGKGTYDQIAAKIHWFSRKYKWYTEGDHVTFDAHVTVEMLKLTHRFYQRCYANDRKLISLSRRTINNKCRTRHGDRYDVRGTRMSGDVDTSFGNSIINYYILRSLLFELGLQGDAIVNGDDFILFTDRPVPVSDAIRILRSYNMDTKLVRSVDNIHRVEFCRTKMVLHPDGHPTMAFDPKRLHDIFGCTFIKYTSSQYRDYLKTVSHANYMINLNSPIHRLWTPLEKLESKLKKYMMKDLQRVFNKQLSNRPWTTTEITPSYREAYPDFSFPSKPYNIFKPVRTQRHTIIVNHRIKEVSIL
jgi:hypothetical protein